MASASFLEMLKKLASKIETSSFKKWAPCVILVFRFFEGDQNASILNRSGGILDHAAKELYQSKHWMICYLLKQKLTFPGAERLPEVLKIVSITRELARQSRDRN